MSEFTKGKRSDLPLTRHRRPANERLATAILALKDDDAILVPAIEGLRLERMQMRVATLVLSLARPRKTFATTQDRERNGVWVYLRRNGGSA